MKLSKANIKRLEKGLPPVPSEDDVQSQIVQGLKAYGYLVLVTTRRMLKCPKCGERSHKGDRADKGVADLLVRKLTGWPNGLWLSLEVKKSGPVRYSSIEQRQLVSAGDVILVQSLEDALKAVQGVG